MWGLSGFKISVIKALDSEGGKLSNHFTSKGGNGQKEVTKECGIIIVKPINIYKNNFLIQKISPDHHKSTSRILGKTVNPEDDGFMDKDCYSARFDE